MAEMRWCPVKLLMVHYICNVELNIDVLEGQIYTVNFPIDINTTVITYLLELLSEICSD